MNVVISSAISTCPELFGEKYTVKWRYEQVPIMGNMGIDGVTTIVRFAGRTECEILKWCEGISETIAYGFAMCHENDVYDKKEGRKKAFSRAVINAFPLMVEDPMKKLYVNNLMYNLIQATEGWYNVSITPTGKEESEELRLNKLRRTAFWNWFHKTINSPEK